MKRNQVFCNFLFSGQTLIIAHELFGHARLHLKGDPAAKEETVPIQIENELRKEQGLPSKEESRVFPPIEVKPKKEEKEQ